MQDETNRIALTQLAVGTLQAKENKVADHRGRRGTAGDKSYNSSTALGLVSRIARKAAYAAMIRIAFGVVKVLLKSRLRPTMRALVNETLTSNPLKWAAVCSGIAAFDCLRTITAKILHQLLGNNNNQETASATIIAAILASLPGVLCFTGKTQMDLGLYLLIRAFHGVLCATFFRSEYVPLYLRTFQHYDVLLSCLTNGFIFYGVNFNPETHNAGYCNFVVSCANTPLQVLTATSSAVHRGLVPPSLIDIVQRTAAPNQAADGGSVLATNWRALSAASAKASTSAPIKAPIDGQLLCHCRHPNQTSCTKYLIVHLVQSLFQFTIPLYFPQKLISALIWKRKALLSQPRQSALDIASKTLRSAAFLTLQSSGLAVICFMNQFNIRSGWLFAVLSGAVMGPPLFLEPKPRRLDLLLFCMMQAVRSAYNMLYLRGVVNRPTRTLASAVYLMSLVTILGQSRLAKDALHSNVQSTLSSIIVESTKN